MHDLYFEIPAAFAYLICPFFTWFVTGCSKFIVNSIKAKSLAFAHIGYGGFPSNHSAIVSSMVALIALREGIENPGFGAALTLAFIVILDANSLRLKIALHAKHINQLNPQAQLRERIGHSKIEILAGIVVGIGCAWIINAAL